MKKNNTSIQMIADVEGDISTLFCEGKDGKMPLLVTRNMVVFPGVVTPLLIGRQQSLRLIDELRKAPETVIAIFCQKDENDEVPRARDIYEWGVLARLVRTIDMPDSDNVTAIFQGLGRCRRESMTHAVPFYEGTVQSDIEIMPSTPEEKEQFGIAVADLRDVVSEYIHKSDEMPNESEFAIKNIKNDTMLVNFVCANAFFAVPEKIELLKIDNMMDRVMTLLRRLNRDIQFMELRHEIRNKTREDLDEQQREYFLQQQIKNIKQELGNGEGSPEQRELAEKGRNKNWSFETQKLFFKELDKLEMYNPQSPEYAIQLNYLNQMINLPWNEMTKDDLSLQRAKKVLDKDHYGMEKVKERILEYISVLKLRSDLKAPILCLYGPPGVGKTSLGRSIATALKRNYVRVSLGGVHDESEIRGHRRTYVGAMPGRIIKSIQKAGSSNPVFILDEIDKVAQNTLHGDPSSALLEVLDPEQNNAFHDNYLDIDYDLSNVLFIATANDLGGIPRPLLDRMEIIEVSGYITEEKVEIAKRHLVPREIENNGIDHSNFKISFTKPALETIIERYTRESGVRQLEKQIGKCMRKIAYKIASEGSIATTKITPTEIETLLGKAPFYRDIYQGNEYAGVVTGLAWTSVGGEILFIETSLSKGKPGKLTLTGNLGDVMKESAVIALEYIKAHIDVLGVDYRIFDQYNIHIHVPEGATPKDGPSAGITIATSIASALTQRQVRKNVAMTGEITLRGKVLPVGGIKEKILAAKRAGITDIMLCKDNRKDIEEIPEIYLKGVQFHYVENVLDVWNFALTDKKVADAVEFTLEDEKKD
ncbi:MAG: endopeptidase La [Prevotellaceae bacterium]|nr:endopeptidase La [Prevotellaceae bacterium]